MNKIIYKETLELTTRQVKKLPKNARILSVQIQNNEITFWYLFESVFKSDLEEKTFYIYGTGSDDISYNLEYVGTVQLNTFVWHIFTKIE